MFSEIFFSEKDYYETEPVNSLACNDHLTMKSATNNPLLLNKRPGGLVHWLITLNLSFFYIRST